MSQQNTLNNSIAAVYAAALYDAAINAGVLDDVLSDIASLVELVHNQPVLIDFFHSPAISSDQKMQMMERLIGSYLNPLTLKTLKSMAHRNRLELFREFVQQMELLHRSRRGRMMIDAVSSMPLSPPQIQQIESALSTKYKAQVSLNVTLSPGLIGGIQLKIGDTFVDGSVRRKLSDMTRLVKHAALTDVAADSQRLVVT
ncbi:MAG: ATP synthase F1 subunit delta [Phycisphaerae bacterium]